MLGKVIAIGPGELVLADKQLKVGDAMQITPEWTYKPIDIKVGQKVSFNQHAGSDIEVGLNKYRILSVRDVLAIIQ